jgi:serine/threonine protein kinase
MHGKRIAHRDVKLENIMVADDASVSGGVSIKLLDFGFARRLAPADACSDSGGSGGSAALLASPETVLRRMRGSGSLAPHTAAAAAAIGAQLAAATAASDGVARFAATVGALRRLHPQ